MDRLESNPGSQSLLAQLGHAATGRARPEYRQPKVLAAHLEGLRALVPIIVEWQRRLPASRRGLFGGVKLGSEAGIGYNAYYYPDGNHY